MNFFISVDDNQVENVRGMTPQFPYVCVEYEYANVSIPWHWHEAFEFKLVLRGAMRVTTEQSEFVLNQGEVSFTNSDVLETSSSVDEAVNAAVISFVFHPVLLGGHYQSVFEDKYLKPVMNNRQIDLMRITSESEAGKRICRQLAKLGKLGDGKNAEFRVRNILSEIWEDLLLEIDEQMRKRPASTIPSQDRIRYMLKYIHMHYQDRISMKEIAESANISEREALRTFRKMLNKTPVDYLTEYRLSKARELLTETEDSITEIALNTGFADSAYFGKVFRKYIGVSPGTYRKENKRSLVF